LSKTEVPKAVETKLMNKKENEFGITKKFIFKRGNPFSLNGEFDLVFFNREKKIDKK